MADGILGNAVGAFGFPKTYIMTDSDGNEFTGVYVESETIFTATDNDVREGMVYASDRGVSVGTKDIPSYYTHFGAKAIAAGKSFIISNVDYDYIELQAVICSYNTNLSNSVSTTMSVIKDNVYAVQSTESIAVVKKNHTNQAIELGITNNTGKPLVLRYIFTKEAF